MVLNAGRRNAICPEICCSCEMDHFEASLLQGKIGAPMDTRPILTFVANVCKRAMSVTQSADPNVSVIADILSTVEGEVDLDMTEMPVSRVLFLRASEETGV